MMGTERKSYQQQWEAMLYDDGVYGPVIPCWWTGKQFKPGAGSMVITPECALPTREPLTQLDEGVGLGSSDQTMCNLFRGKPDVPRMQAAFARVVTKNPILASRITKVDGKLVFSCDGPVGCPFYACPMDDQLQRTLQSTLTAEAMATDGGVAVQKLFHETLHIPKVGTGRQLVDKDLPLCKVTVMAGSELALVVFSFSHAVGDLCTYSTFARAWQEEFDSPGASLPMEPRMECGMDNHKAYQVIGQPGITRVKRDGEKHTLTVRLTRAEEKQMKAKIAAELPPNTIFSGNDMTLAHISNALAATAIIYPADVVRGTNGIPKRSMGNSFATRLVHLTEPGSKFHALDVRKVQSVSDPSGAVLVEPMKLHMTTSWDKGQYWPTFGMELLSSNLMGLDWFKFGTIYTTRYKANEDEYVIISSGLLADEVAALEHAWKAAGVNTMGSAPFTAYP